MGGRKTDGSLHVSSPFVERLIGETEHKVDTYILNSSLFYNPNGINRLRRCVSTMKKLQSRVVESLNAHTYTVDAEWAQTANKLRCYIIGVDLDGHFARIAGETFRYWIENVLNVGEWESGRSSAPNVYRIDRIRAVDAAQSVEFGATQVHFLYQSRSIIVLQSE